MNLIICLDDNNGLLFNHRRQSRDSKVIEDIMSNLTGKLYVDTYTASLFSNYKDRIEVTISPLETAEEDETCFVEKFSSVPIDNVQALTIYRWNRIYPYDVSFDIDIKSFGFTLEETYDFVGTSHDKITKEVYRK